MCDILSRIEGERCWFVTSAQAAKYLREHPDYSWADVGGHSIIKLIHPEAIGVEREGLPAPKDMIATINSGKLDKLNREAHLQYIRVDANGKLNGRYRRWDNHGKLELDTIYNKGEEVTDRWQTNENNQLYT